MSWEPDPPGDSYGNVLPHDDPVMVPSAWPLLRHIHAEHWAPDGNGGYRPQSIGFTFSTDGSGSMSVDIEPPMEAAGLSPTHYAFAQGKGVVRIKAVKARELGLRVGPEPIKDKNPHHGGIWPPEQVISDNQLRKKCRSLSRCYEFVALPPGGVQR